MKELIAKYRLALQAPAVSIYEQNPQGSLIGMRATEKLYAVRKHASWMLDNMPAAETDPFRFNRWLGFVQALFWGIGIFSLDELRDQTREAAKEGVSVWISSLIPSEGAECYDGVRTCVHLSEQAAYEDLAEWMELDTRSEDDETGETKALGEFTIDEIKTALDEERENDGILHWNVEEQRIYP